MNAFPSVPATSWREGLTVTYLIDFLDDDGSIAFRVYYQDAPSDGPVGPIAGRLISTYLLWLLVVEIGVAPAEPLEFILVRLRRKGDGTLALDD